MSDVDDKAIDRMWSLLYKGAYSDCLQLARTIIQVQPDNWGARMFEGNCLLELKDYDGAIESLNECLRINPDFFPAIASRGETYFYKQDYDRALADLEEALRNIPFPGFYQLASVCLYKKGNTAKAYDYINRAIEEGGDGNTYVQKASFLEQDGEYKEALKYYEKGAEELPDDKTVKVKIKKLKHLTSNSSKQKNSQAGSGVVS